MFTTFGPGDLFVGEAVGFGGAVPRALAVSFVASFSGTFDSIRVPVSDSDGSNSYVFSLATDSSGTPGSSLETLSGLVFPSDLVISTVSSSTHPMLSTGSTYWVVLAPTHPSSGSWNVNGVGIFGVSLNGIATGFAWFSVPSTLSPAVEVNASAIPEPATVGLTFAGLTALVILLRRASRTA